MVKEFLDKLKKNKLIGNLVIILSSILLIYLITSIYFINHFFFNTEINGVNLSLRNYKEANEILESYINNYSLQIIGRDGRSEDINGRDIELTYKDKNIINYIKKDQSSIKWIESLFSEKDYYIDGLVNFNEETLTKIVDDMDIINKGIVEPVDVSFKYNNGIYEIESEVYGNKINKDKLITILIENIRHGEKIVDLEKSLCYENPKYTSNSDKTIETRDLLNKYVSTKITYLFAEKKEELNGDIINNWLKLDEDLNVVINEKALEEYIAKLSKNYNTVGITRKFNTSTGQIVDVNGGYYGWKINSVAEEKMLIENIKLGANLEKEPIYSQKGLYREEDDIGNTYVEINITRQYLWFYKDGKVIAEGGIVTGDPRKGYSTPLGTYMINYKQRDAVLRGQGYESKVSYWMPFNGNIGIHDASWRYSFGNNIYENNGTHGCVNSPLSLAKKVYENIEAGTPVICYKE
ncbi:L,D-transpeptidase family protein [Clostridium nigeriense]|uniref:L,D-transpeptidase family protein n=1 Tax=Clostridium nigeriense TaxID=1805470 RepID=UPI003D32EE89